MSSVVLSDDEVIAASGGYTRAADQLKVLHGRGFHRAYVSPKTGKVVLERPHYDAVASGTAAANQAPTARKRPKLREVTT
jgi:hypothetical protein